MASILKVDELRGIVSAGDITVTSEGGAATQSLQQGLAKAWGDYDATSNSMRNSFNIASVTDNGGPGDFTYAWTNSFDSANYAPAGTAGSGRGGGNTNCVIAPTDTTFTSSQVRTGAIDLGGTYRDVQDNLLHVMGDLA